MSDETATRNALDEAVRAHMSPHLDPEGEVIVAWLALAVTRGHDGGGVVIHAGSDEAMPMWQVRGIIAEMQSVLDRSDGDEDTP